MTLATHIIVGAAGARLFAANPIQGFIIGWLSHYLVDSIIHWDYSIGSIDPKVKGEKSNRDALLKRKLHFRKGIVVDIGKVIVDVCVGFLLAFLFLRDPSKTLNLTLLAGALGSTMPDFLQFTFFAWKNKPVEILQRFHNFMHAERDLNDRPVLGVSIQLAIVIVIFILFNN